MTHHFGCNACGATYFDLQPDGAIYHHACAPLPPTDAGIQPERENKRDENLQLGPHRRAIGIKAEGDGVTCLTDARITEPKWITAMHDRIEKGGAKRAY